MFAVNTTAESQAISRVLDLVQRGIGFRPSRSGVLQLRRLGLRPRELMEQSSEQARDHSISFTAQSASSCCGERGIGFRPSRSGVLQLRRLGLRPRELMEQSSEQARDHSISFTAQSASSCCGERGIRTLGTGNRHTRFPGVPLKPLGHLSKIERRKTRRIGTLAAMQSWQNRVVGA